MPAMISTAFDGSRLPGHRRISRRVAGRFEDSRIRFARPFCKGSALLGALLIVAVPVRSQDVEPRRWTHLPVDTNFAGGGMAFSKGDVVFDPVLQIEEATVELWTYGIKYIRTFECWGKSARIEVSGSYQDGTWDGLLQGKPASTSRSGFKDPKIRLAVNLAGAPPLRGKAFTEYHRSHRSQTVLGAGLWVGFPLGEYRSDRLINLGNNRFTIVPQVGATHTQGRWTGELTGAVWFYTDNHEFLRDQVLEREPLIAGQAHLIYSVLPGLWTSGSMAYGYGGETRVDGQASNNAKDALFFALHTGCPISRSAGAKISWIAQRSRNHLYGDVDTLAASLTYRW